MMILSTQAEKPDEQHTISYSEYWAYRDSPARWDYQYRQKLEPRATPDYLTRGKYMHLLLEEKLTGQPSPERATFGELPEDSHELANQAELWKRNFAKDFTPLAVEQEFYADVGLVHPVTGKPVLLYGFIDAYGRDRAGRLILMEHKTAKRRWSARQKTVQPQAHFYAAALYALINEWPRFMQYNFFLPKGVTETHSLYLIPDETRFWLEQLQHVVNSVRAEEPPAPVCSCMFGNCSYLDLCDAKRSGIGSIESIIAGQYQPRTSSRDSTEKEWRVVPQE